MFEGGCVCGEIRYRVEIEPMFVHCCHCRWCQRETGSAFVLNALVESNQITTVNGTPETVNAPSESGEGQKIMRCPKCWIAVWSTYATSVGDRISFVRVGTLDQPDRMPPDIHIFTASKQPWLDLPASVPALSEYYDRRQFWPAESLTRYQALRG